MGSKQEPGQPPGLAAAGLPEPADGHRPLGGRVETAVHNEAFGVWMDIQWSKANDTANEYRRQYLDTEDRVVLPGGRRSGFRLGRRLLLRRVEHEVGDARARSAARINGSSSTTSGQGRARPIFIANSPNTWSSTNGSCRPGRKRR